MPDLNHLQRALRILQRFLDEQWRVHYNTVGRPRNAEYCFASGIGNLCKTILV